MRYVGIGLVYGYRYTFGLLVPAGTCKYHPSCSQYALDASGSTASSGAPRRPAGGSCAATRGATEVRPGMILPLLILEPIEKPLTALLEWLHASVGLTWAWSIVALTIIVRTLLLPLTVRQIHSMQRLQRHAPEMKAIQQRYKHDRPKQQEELMKFYRENKINPASSCLPILFQIPVFLALFFVLRGLREGGLPEVPGLGPRLALGPRAGHHAAAELRPRSRR